MTALEHITAALRLIGVVAEGEIPGTDTALDAMSSFNEMLDSWSIASAHSFQLQAVPWASGVTSKTVGLTGQFVGNPPVEVRSSTYYMMGGVQFPLHIINETEWREWCSDGQTGKPEYIWINYTAPDPTVYLYPVPGADITLYISSVAELTQITDLTDEIIVPQGYRRALRYNLAIELAPEFGVEPSATVVRMAKHSKGLINAKNLINSKSNRLHLPYPLRHSSANILNG